MTVARVHRLLAEDPDAPELNTLIDELHDHSPEFAALWQRHDVAVRHNERRPFHHPVVGDLTLESETLYLGDNGPRMTVYQAIPGTADHRAMRALCQATPGQPGGDR